MVGKRFVFRLSLCTILSLTCSAQAGSSASSAAQEGTRPRAAVQPQGATQVPTLTGPGVSGAQANAPAWRQGELDGLLQRSSLVLWGSVDQADSYWRENARGRHIYTRVSIWPKGWALGALAEAPVVFEVMGGTVAGMTESVSNVPDFHAGAEVIVFLTGRPYRLLGGRGAKLEVSEGKVYWGAELPAEVFLEGVRLRAAGQSAEALWERESRGLQVAVAGPVITSITPEKASAGTRTPVVISGSGFGTTQGTSAVEFFYCSGKAKLAAPIVSWSDTRLVCSVPVGPIEGDQVSAGSGPVTVRTSGGTSNGVLFRVTFGYGQKKWPGAQPTVQYYVNENAWDCSGEAAAIQRAMSSWNAVGAKLAFQYMGSHTNTIATQNFRNELLWGSEEDVAVTHTWSYVSSGDIVECDTVFSDSRSWSTSSSAGGNEWDVESIALHETGHWLMLEDLYGDAGDGTYDEDKVMYGYGSTGQILRTLHAGDQAGLWWIYPPGEQLTGSSQSGNISPTGDADWWYFTVLSSATYTVETSPGTLTDTIMALYGPNDQATLLGENDDKELGNGASKIMRTLSAGTYYVKVRAYADNSTGTYTIRLTSDQTDLVGTWTVTYNWNNAGSGSPFLITFNPDGTFTREGATAGTWTQSGNSVSWTYTNGAYYTGTLSSATSMSGTMLAASGMSGTWYAARQ